MAHKTTFLAGLIFLLSSLLFAQGEFHGPVYIIGDDGRLYIDHIPDTITASYLAVIDDGWVKKLDIDNLELDTSNIAGLYDYLNAKSDTGHVHDTSDVNNLSLYLGQKLDISDTSDLARKIHDHTISDVTGLQDALELKLNIADTSVFVRDPELNNYYTKTNLQTSGQSQVHAGNITNAPWLTGVNWDEIGGNQSLVNVSGFNNDAGYLDTLPIHDHTISNVTGLQDALDLKLNISDTSVFVRDPELDNYYTKTNLSTSGQSSVHWNNITNEPAFITGVNWNEIGGSQSSVNISGFNNDAGYLTSLPSHDHDGRYPLKSLGSIRSGYAYEAMEADRNTLADGM